MGGSSSSSKSDSKDEQIVPAEPKLTPEEQEECRRKIQLETNLRIIEKAKSDSASMNSETTNLKLQVAQFWVTMDANNPNLIHKKDLEGLKKSCLTISEALMRCLFSLDSIVESPETRNERKQLVVYIQGTLAGLDEIKNSLQTILDKLKELEPPPQQVTQEESQQEQSAEVQPMQTQDNNTTPASHTPPAIVESEVQTLDSGII